MIVAFGAADPGRLDVFALADELWRRGWYVDRQQPPDSLHCTVNAVHDGLIPEFVAELHAAIDTIVDAARCRHCRFVRHGRVTAGRRVQIDVQFNPAAAPWPLFRDATLAAEAAGFGAVWVLDHLAGVSMQGSGMLECFTCLGALATTTTTIGLGTLVANVWNREPGVLAVAAASVCEIADRPILLGLGAGTSPTSKYAAEQHAVGATIAATLAERHARVGVVARSDRHDVRSRPAGAVRDVPTPPPSSDDVARREQRASGDAGRSARRRHQRVVGTPAARRVPRRRRCGAARRLAVPPHGLRVVGRRPPRRRNTPRGSRWRRPGSIV